MQENELVQGLISVFMPSREKVLESEGGERTKKGGGWGFRVVGKAGKRGSIALIYVRQAIEHERYQTLERSWTREGRSDPSYKSFLLYTSSQSFHPTQVSRSQGQLQDT